MSPIELCLVLRTANSFGTQDFSMLLRLCWDYCNWFQDNLNNLLLILDKMCIPIVKSKSAAYYANVIFTKAITMVSSSKTFRILKLGQWKDSLKKHIILNKKQTNNSRRKVSRRNIFSSGNVANVSAAERFKCWLWLLFDV